MKFMFSIPLETILLLSLTEIISEETAKVQNVKLYFLAIQIIASIVGISTNSTRGKEYFSYEFKRIKYLIGGCFVKINRYVIVF